MTTEVVDLEGIGTDTGYREVCSCVDHITVMQTIWMAEKVNNAKCTHTRI